MYTESEGINWGDDRNTELRKKTFFLWFRLIDSDFQPLKSYGLLHVSYSISIVGLAFCLNRRSLM